MRRTNLTPQLKLNILISGNVALFAFRPYAHFNNRIYSFSSSLCQACVCACHRYSIWIRCYFFWRVHLVFPRSGTHPCIHDEITNKCSDRCALLFVKCILIICSNERMDCHFVEPTPSSLCESKLCTRRNFCSHFFACINILTTSHHITSQYQ